VVVNRIGVIELLESRVFRIYDAFEIVYGLKLDMMKLTVSTDFMSAEEHGQLAITTY
jgi:hypothetical protein